MKPEVAAIMAAAGIVGAFAGLLLAAGGPLPAADRRMERLIAAGERRERRAGSAYRLALLRKAIPPGLERHLWSYDAEALAALSGRGLTPTDVHLGGTLIGLVMTLALLALGGPAGRAGWAVAVALGAGMALAGPKLVVSSITGRHRAAVGRELPRVAELMTLATESGLGLLEAAEMAGALTDGVVGRGIRRAMSEISAGRDVPAALRGIASHLGGRAAASFVAAVVQGLDLGAPLARVLRSQAETLRSGRRQALEARIAGLSMRLTLVTVALFVPALFVLAVLPNLIAFLTGRW